MKGKTWINIYSNCTLLSFFYFRHLFFKDFDAFCKNSISNRSTIPKNINSIAFTYFTTLYSDARNKKFINLSFFPFHCKYLDNKSSSFFNTFNWLLFFVDSTFLEIFQKSMNKSMNFWMNFILINAGKCFWIRFTSKSKDISLASGSLFEINHCNLSNIRFKNIDCQFVLLFESF